jgi:hypothetical protein
VARFEIHCPAKEGEVFTKKRTRKIMSEVMPLLQELYPDKTRIKGVGFWDEIHGQTGVAPNGIELHPVLRFRGTCSRT